MRSTLDRFWPKVDCTATNDCWVWTAAVDSSGRPCFRAGGGMRIAYRWLYEQLVGPVPEGLELDHLCMNPRCVNPSHLEPVSRRENARRRGATVIACINGHLYDETTTYLRRNGTRNCRVCAREHKRRHLERRASAS